MHHQGAMCRAIGALLVAVVCASTARAGEASSAADKATARALALDGLTDQRAGRFTEALEKLQRAQAIFAAPAHLLAIARCQVELTATITSVDGGRSRSV